MEEFWAFVLERDLIRQRREAGLPRPWTSDPTLDRYQFCNIFRDLDRGTKLYLSQLEEHSDRPLSEKLFNTILFRQVTNRQAWLELGWQKDGFDPACLKRLWQSRKARGLPMYSGNITSPIYSVVPGETTIDRMMTCARVWYQDSDLDFESIKDLRELFLIILELPAIGKFYGWQVTMDFSFILGLSQDEWCHLGPGCWSGLREVFGADVFKVIRKDGKVKRCGFRQPSHGQSAMGLPYLIKLRDEQPDLPLYRRLTLGDLEHSLCEYSKYQRIIRKERNGRNFIPYQET